MRICDNLQLASVDNRDRRGGPRRDNTSELSCFWFGGNGHTLFDCPKQPPNAKAKAAWDKVAADKEQKASRLEDRREPGTARRIAPATTSDLVTDDEDEEYSD